MKAGDKVRLKDTWGGPTSFDGFEAEVLNTEEHVGNTYLKPLSDRPDGYKREEFYWPTGKLEVIEPEHIYEVGDKVKILSRPVFGSDPVGAVKVGDIGTITHVWYEGRYAVDSGDRRGWSYDTDQIEPYAEVDTQKIEVGDKVLALHTDGTTVTGFATFVADYGREEAYNVDINMPGEYAECHLYSDEGWTFEVLEKKPAPVAEPKVGDNLTPNLPVGTVIVLDTIPNSTLVKSRTGKWNGDLGGEKDEDLVSTRWKIVYLPIA